MVGVLQSNLHLQTSKPVKNLESVVANARHGPKTFTIGVERLFLGSGYLSFSITATTKAKKPGKSLPSQDPIHSATIIRGLVLSLLEPFLPGQCSSC